jgi:lipocalin
MCLFSDWLLAHSFVVVVVAIIMIIDNNNNYLFKCHPERNELFIWSRAASLSEDQKVFITLSTRDNLLRWKIKSTRFL